MTLRLTGVHHVSTLSSNIQRSRDFYTQALGMRPVITTVNQDEPTMYHLFFGDGAGTPGSDITVFDMPHVAREKRGTNSISLTSFRVSGDDVFEFWMDRLEEYEVWHGGVQTRAGRRVLDFEDYEATQLCLVDDGGAGDAFPWSDSPVPAEHQIRGLGYTTLTVPDLEPTDQFLTIALGLTYDHRADENTHVYRIGDGGAHAEVHVVVRNDIPRARYGGGAVHHVALRVPDQPMEDWVERLDDLGYVNSGVVDRHYFKSVYVREPNHILFELATDSPGFEVDGPMDDKRLSLPPFLEPRRAEIEARLKRLK